MSETTFTKSTLKATLALTALGAVLALTPLYTQHAEAATLKTERSAPSGTKVAKTVDLTCMQTAVDTREDSIMTTHDTYGAAIKAALTSRKATLHDAWGLTDATERKTAIKSAWGTWKNAHKDAREDLKSSKKEAWTAFKTTAKSSCKEELPKEEATKTDVEA